MFNAEIPTGIESKNLVLSVFMDKLREFVASDPFDEYGCRLAMDEALTNAMEHGNKWDPQKMVFISVSKNTHHLKISVSDEGAGFSDARCFDAITDTGPLPLRGRGLKIIRQFCSPRWNERGNRIELIIDLA